MLFLIFFPDHALITCPFPPPLLLSLPLSFCRSLADIKSSGQLTFPEFAVALYLTAQQAKDRNNAPPPSLTPEQLNELHRAVAHVLTPVGNPRQPDRARTPEPSSSSSLIDLTFSPPPSSQAYHNPMGHGPPQGQFSSMQTASYASNSMGHAMVPAGGMGGGGHAPPPSFQPPPPPPSSSSAGFFPTDNVPWVVTPEQKAGYDQIFRAWDNGTGYLGGERAKEIFMQTGLGPQSLEKIWSLADTHNHGRLNSDEFAVAMHLTHEVLAGKPLPVRLTPELIPPSTRNLSSTVSSLKADLVEDIMHQRHTGGAYVGSRSTSGPGRGSNRRPTDDWDAPTRVPKMGPLHDAHDRYGSYNAGFPDTSRSRNSDPRSRKMITYGQGTDDDLEAETAYTSKARRAIPSRESSKSRDPWASLRSTTDRWGTGGLETPSNKSQTRAKEMERSGIRERDEKESEEDKVARWKKELGEQRVILETIQYKVGDPSISYATKEELEARVEERKVKRRIEELERWIHRIEGQWKRQGSKGDGRGRKLNQEEKDRQWMEEKILSKGGDGPGPSGWKKGSLEVDYNESDTDDEEEEEGSALYAQTLKEEGEEGLRERMDRERRLEEEKEREAKYAEMQRRRQDREAQAKKEEEERRKARPGETEEQRVRRLAEERLAARMAALSIPSESPPRSPRSSSMTREEEEKEGKASSGTSTQAENMADRLARAGSKEERQKILEEEAEKRMREREAFLRATGGTPPASASTSKKEAKIPSTSSAEGGEKANESGGSGEEALGEKNPFKRMMSSGNSSSSSSPISSKDEPSRVLSSAAVQSQATKEEMAPDGQRREEEEMALMKELYERRRDEERRKEEDRRREREDVMAGAKKAREEVMRKAQAAKESAQSSPSSSSFSIPSDQASIPAPTVQSSKAAPGFQKGLALFDYTAMDAQGLSLTEGEDLEVEEASLVEESDWVYGRKQGGTTGVQEGWVPRTYVQCSMGRTGPALADASLTNPSSTVPTASTTTPTPTPTTQTGPHLRLIYPYEAADTDELTVAEDEVVEKVLGSDKGDGWIRVRRLKGPSNTPEEGLIPETYCEPVSEDEVSGASD